MKKLMTSHLVKSVTCGLFIVTAVSTNTAIAAEVVDSALSTLSPSENQSLKFKISARINDMYPGNNVEVTVFSKQVLLTGQVATSDIKDSASKVATDLASGQKVLNYIDVQKNQIAAQTRSDSLITTKATAKILTISGVSSNDIKVVTTNSVMYLMGRITESQATAVLNNMKLIKGVRKVVPLFTYPVQM